MTIYKLLCTIDYIHSQMTIQLTIYIVKWIYNWLYTKSNDYTIDAIQMTYTVEYIHKMNMTNYYTIDYIHIVKWLYNWLYT